MLEEIVAGGASALGISLPQGAPALYRRYYERLTEANRRFNLTAIEGEDEAARLHFLDSAAALKFAGLAGKSVIDVGTGGGLPGLAMKIAEPAMELTLLDATEKKVAFLASLTEELGIPCRCVAGRAEELSRQPEHRERYDAAVARAMAAAAIFTGAACLPFVRVGGKFLALKAAASDGEIDAARSAIAALGGNISGIYEYTIPGAGILRRVVVVEKTAPTPEKYPRRWSAMVKRGA